MTSESRGPSVETLKRIDLLCDQFESDCRNNLSPSLESYLSKVPQNEQSLLFRSILEIQLELEEPKSYPKIEKELLEKFPEEQDTISEIIQNAITNSKNKTPEENNPNTTNNKPTNKKQKHYKQIGRFEIKAILGQGGFGTVYKAYDPQAEEEVAIKVPLESTLNSKENLERFLREGNIARKLDFPGICPIHEIGEVQNLPYIVMKFINGPSLSDIHKRMNNKNRLMNISKSIQLIKRIGESVEHAHQNGVIHRDLKPSNIIWDKNDSTPFITDFGLARIWNDDESNPLTVTGQGMGTPAYIAPEQAKGNSKDLGENVDIYSLGIIFYELLCGERPFPGNSFDVVIQKSAEDPPPPSTYRSEIDAQLDAICLKVIARSKEDRYQSVREFLDDLTKYEDGGDLSLQGDYPKSSSEDTEPLERLAYSSNPDQIVIPESQTTITKWKEANELDFDPYYRWLGITVRKRPISHYRLLGITRNESDNQVIFEAAERQKMNVKAFKADAGSYIVARILYEIEEARFVLMDSDFRERYDRFLREKKKKANWHRRYQKWRRKVLKNSNLPEEYIIHSSTRSGFVEEFAMIFSIIFIGFVLMALISFYLPWDQLIDDKKNEQQANANLAVQQPNIPKPQPQIGNQDNKEKDPPEEAKPDEVNNPAKDENPSEQPVDLKQLVLNEEWTDLIPGINVNEFGLKGNWNLANHVLTSNSAGGENVGSIHLPVNTPEHYQLEIKIDSTFNNEESVVVVLLPVANKRFEVGIDSDWVEIRKIRNEEYRSTYVLPKSLGEEKDYEIIWNNRAVGRYLGERESGNSNVFGIRYYLDVDQPISLINSNQQAILMDVNQDGKQARIKVILNGNLAMDWTGPIDDILESSELSDWNQINLAGIGLVTKSMPANFHQIRIRKGDPEAVPVLQSILASQYINKPPEPITQSTSEIKDAQEKVAEEKDIQEREVNGIGMPMILIPPGTFIMGSPEDESDRQKQELAHPVNISKPYYIGQTEVTRDQFSQFIKETGYITDRENENRTSQTEKRKYSWKSPGKNHSGTHPVNYVSWNDAIAFCNWLTKKEKRFYRLPTEAEWEYACRAGKNTAYSFGNSPKLMKNYGNTLDNSSSDGYPNLAPVKRFRANTFSLYDMHGNVAELCLDSRFESVAFLSKEKTRIDPVTLNSNLEVVYRGGAWMADAKLARAAHRNYTSRNGSHSGLGFRVVAKIGTLDPNSPELLTGNQFSPTANSAQEPKDLLAAIDLNRHVISGEWKKGQTELSAGKENVKTKEYNSIRLPLKTALNYQLDLEFDQRLELEEDRKTKRISDIELNSDIYLSLPVSNKRCQIGLYGDWIELSQILNEEKRDYNIVLHGDQGNFPAVKNFFKVGRYNNHSKGNKNALGFGSYFDDGSNFDITDDGRHKLSVLVHCDQQLASIRARVDDRTVLEWIGPLSDLEDTDSKAAKAYWNKQDRSGILLSSHGLVVNYYQIEFTELPARRVSIPPSLAKLAKTPYAKNPPKPINRTAEQIQTTQKMEARKNKIEIQETNSIGMKLTLIPDGTFIMGSPKKTQFRIGNELQHPVKISKPFFLGTHEVTLGQFQKFVDETGYTTDAEKSGGHGYEQEDNIYVFRSKAHHWKNPGFPQTEMHPVVNVSWNDAIEFCKWLSKKENRTYRLPTEAEWEYACRAGTSSFWYFPKKAGKTNYENFADLEFSKRKPGHGWWGGKQSDGHIFTSPVGNYQPNPFGLHDMLGNVREWCQDTFNYHAYFLSDEKIVTDPVVKTPGLQKVARGGSWYSGDKHSSADYRGYFIANSVELMLGFRVVREL